jgi:hypothetical protein
MTFKFFLLIMFSKSFHQILFCQLEEIFVDFIFYKFLSITSSKSFKAYFSRIFLKITYPQKIFLKTFINYKFFKPYLLKIFLDFKKNLMSMTSILMDATFGWNGIMNVSLKWRNGCNHNKTSQNICSP